jgi:hypothetical protein
MQQAQVQWVLTPDCPRGGVSGSLAPIAISGTPKDLIYPAAGQAIVVQDELANTWQKLPEGQ